MFNLPRHKSLANKTQKQQAKTQQFKTTKLPIKPILSRPNAWLLWFSQCANVALISPELSPWMLAILMLSILWQALLLNKRVASNNQVSSLLLAVFAIAGCIAIIISAKGLGALGSMVHLLCFSYVLKAFELKQRRDLFQLWLLGLFVLASALIFRQNLAFAIFSFVVLIINLAVLLQFFSSVGPLSASQNKSIGKTPSQLSINEPLKKSLTESLTESWQVMQTVFILVMQSMVLAIVLFIVLPRLAPFWQVPLAKSAKTGLSDTVKPGDIANLARSTELAFRAEFTGNVIPNYSQLYWRAMTLENYDGRQWTRATVLREKQSNNSDKILEEMALAKTSSLQTAYQVIAEPSYQRYLFALAPATSTDNELTAFSDYTWQAKKPVNQGLSYTLQSYLTAPLELELTLNSAKVNLTYPINSNPKLEALAQQLRLDYVDVEVRAQVILNMISQQNFFYTLQPPLLVNNSLDQFFFSTKAGFCVHYASAFTFLMRASGVPARVVTGYLGGEYNDKNANDKAAQGHLSIYQYDAHAWSEIWVQGKGWLRVDPTGAVDPQRVNSGWSMQLFQQQSALNNDFISLYRFKQLAWLNNLRLQFDALDYQWTRLVLGYSAEQQINLLKQIFGEMKPWKLALIITSSLIFSFVVLMLIFKWRDREKAQFKALTPWLVLYQQALTLLAKYGLKKQTSITVNTFAKQVRIKYPSIAIHFTRLSNTFNQLSYQQLSASEQQQLIKKMHQQYHSLAQATKRLKAQKSQTE